MAIFHPGKSDGILLACQDFESEGREFESLRARQIFVSGAKALLPIRVEASALKFFDFSVKHCTRFAAPRM
jgi:hypothetical protein